MSEDITIKQRKWIKLYLEYGNATKAAREVYDCKNEDSAKVIGHENLTKLNYQDFLEEAGITDDLLQRKIIEGLDANKTVSAMKTSRDAGADSSDFIDVPDFMARHKYLETALKLKKRLVDKMELDANIQGNITINIDEIIGLSNTTTKTTASTAASVQSKI
jgi:phage terminase small subunit